MYTVMYILIHWTVKCFDFVRHAVLLHLTPPAKFSICHLQSGKKHQFEMGFASAVLIHCIENETSNILWKCCCSCCWCCYRARCCCCCSKWITTCNSIEPAQLSIDTNMCIYKSIVCSARMHSFFSLSVCTYNLYLCFYPLTSLCMPYEKKECIQHTCNTIR